MMRAPCLGRATAWAAAGCVALALQMAPTPAQAGAYSDFFKAIEIDRPAPIAALLQRGFDPNTVNLDGTPALIYALQSQSFEAARLLASAPGIMPNVRTERGETPLMLAALRGQLDLVSTLVLRGARVNHEGWTALHYAASGGHERVVLFLLGAQAQINASAPNGTTPLMMAAMYGNAATVKALLESGAHAHTRNAAGLSALDFAHRAGRDDSAAMISQVLARQ